MSHPRAWIGAVVSAVVATALIAPGVGPADAAPQGRSVVGAPTSGDSLFPFQGNGGYDVSNYDIDLSWATSNVITATTTITAATTGDALSKFYLDLEGLTVSAVTVDDVAATFSREAVAQTATATSKFKLVVTPATPVSGTFTTRVVYSGTPVSHTDPDNSKEGWVPTTGMEGAVALNEPVGAMTWFPNNNTPQDKATFATKITVPYNAALPAALNVVGTSNGRLTSTTIGTNTRTFTWTQPKQQAPYLALVGIGRYTVSTGDVALTTGTTPEWSYTDPTAAGSAQFATSRGKLSAILKGLEKYYGPYPGSSTGLVLDVSSLGYALETQDRPYFENTIAESTLIHELGHQWFGDAVSPADWSDIWLNEGPATYIETQIGADLNGSASTQDTYYANWMSSNAAFWATPAAGFTDPSDLFGAQTYDRGAIALEALRSSLGDTVFADVMRTWIETYGGGSATTAQFIAVAEDVSGYDLTDFFQTWIYATTKPATWPVAYELALASTPATGGTVDPGQTVSYTLTATNSGKVPTGASTVEIDVTDLRDQGTLGALPEGVTGTGDTLVWAVPATAVAGTATTTITATLDRGVGGPLAVRAKGRTLGADCGTTGCVSTLTVTDAALTSADPVITGDPRVGQTLTATTPGWTLGTTFAFQWLRAGTPITGATASTYAAVAADQDMPVSVRVTGSKEGFTPVTRTSQPRTVVAADAPVSPTPTVTGTRRVGQTLTAVPGEWSNDAVLTYQWKIDTVAVAGATETTFVPRPEDLGKAVTVTVTGTRTNPASVTDRTSDPVTVLAGELSPTPTPTISGAARTNRTITATPGTWDSGATLTYQWLVAGTPVEGETATTYRVRPTDAGKAVTVAVTGTRTGYTTVTRTSEPVTAGLSTQTRQPRPTVSGTPAVGRTLRAYGGAHDTGVKVTFKWYVGSTAVRGATASTFKLRAQDRGKFVRVQTRAAKVGYTTVVKFGKALRVR